MFLFCPFLLQNFSSETASEKAEVEVRGLLSWVAVGTASGEHVPHLGTSGPSWQLTEY
jgi:hypothetical protein